MVFWYRVMGQLSNQYSATSFPFALVQTPFQYTLSTNAGRKGWQNESSIIFPISFLGGGSKEMQLEGALFFQLHRQHKVNEMRRNNELQHSGISATGELACPSFFAPAQCLLPRQHCSHRLWKHSNCPGKKEQTSCCGLEGKALRKKKKDQGLYSHLRTPTAHQL